MRLAPRDLTRLCVAVGLLFLALPSASSWAGEPDAAGIEFFEKKIRPVLVEKCYPCHSQQAEDAKKLKGGLLLDSRSGILAGGEGGPAVVPGNVAESLLIASLRHESIKMPPKGGKLPDEVIADFVKWVEMNAPDPRDGVVKRPASWDVEKVKKEHWAFQPLRSPEVPRVRDASWVRTPIDAFVLARLEGKGLEPAAEVDRSALLRRVFLDLIGLPPTPAEQRAFLGDGSPQAFEKVVDDLLQRPQYGERWGRHWLDVVRYAETQGYERDEVKPFSWRYRDWVIEALNQDKPYNQFLTEQMAGDELDEPTSGSRVATTFFALGPFDTIAADNRLARYDQLDDILSTTTAAFLGQTLQCARCHDHKFEPLSQGDYYRMLAAFEPLQGGDKPAQIGSEAELAAFREATEKVEAELAPHQADLAGVQLAILERLNKDGVPSGKNVRLQGSRLASLLEALRVAAADRTKAQKDLLAREAKRVDAAVNQLATPEDQEKLEAIRKRFAEINSRRPQPVMAWVFQEKNPKPSRTHLLIRGEPHKPGDEVDFGIPTVLDPGNLPPPSPRPQSPGRRLWLARWMTNEAAGLAARVMVNRVWQYHFGQGFVLDANDMGLHGGPPSHPELLDWLAGDFVQGGWTLKRLHKQIVMSSVYRMKGVNPKADVDPENHLLSRYPVHRLEAEAIRDSMLAIGGRLNLKMGGPSIHPPFDNKIVGDSAGVGWEQSSESESCRRSVYVFAKRAIPLPELALLGLPDSSASCARRHVSTTPVQSLLLLNGKFAAQQSRFLADRVVKEAGDDLSAQIQMAYELALCRPPRPEETAVAREFILRGGKDRLQAFCLVLMNTNEFVYAN